MNIQMKIYLNTVNKAAKETSGFSGFLAMSGCCCCMVKYTGGCLKSFG